MRFSLLRQFVIHLPQDSVVTLAQIGKLLGKHKVDILSLAGTSAFGICTAILFTDDEEKTTELLREINVPFSTQNVLIASLPDEPGAFGHFTQLLFDQGIRVLSFYALRFGASRSDYAFSVGEGDYEKAKAFLDASGFLKSYKTLKKH